MSENSISIIEKAVKELESIKDSLTSDIKALEEQNSSSASSLLEKKKELEKAQSDLKAAHAKKRAAEQEAEQILKKGQNELEKLVIIEKGKLDEISKQNGENAKEVKNAQALVITLTEDLKEESKNHDLRVKDLNSKKEIFQKNLEKLSINEKALRKRSEDQEKREKQLDDREELIQKKSDIVDARINQVEKDKVSLGKDRASVEKINKENKKLFDQTTQNKLSSVAAQKGNIALLSEIKKQGDINKENREQIEIDNSNLAQRELEVVNLENSLKKK